MKDAKPRSSEELWASGAHLDGASLMCSTRVKQERAEDAYIEKLLFFQR